jgi:cation:H+ antiporter
MIWLLFVVTSAIVVAAGIKLAEYSDIIAVRTRLGGLVVGTIFPGGSYFAAGAYRLDQFISRGCAQPGGGQFSGQ